MLLVVVAAGLLAAMAGIGAPPAAAAEGDYDVRLTSTVGSHWLSHGRGAFTATGMKISSGAASFVPGDYRAWRVGVPGVGARIIGGRISTMSQTPDPAMKMRIMAGVEGGAFIALYDGGADGAVDRAITGSSDWVQVDLRATASMSTTRAGTNSVQMTAVDLHLHDDVSPTITPQSLPDPAAWYGSGCVPWSARLADQGGGLDQGTLTNAATGTVVAQWTSPRAESTRPGWTMFDFGGCIGDGARVHGRNDFVLATRDVGGHARSVPLTFRADLAAPTISGGPADGAVFDDGDVDVSFDVVDADSGLASASFSIDGDAVTTSRVGDRWLLDAGRLAVGRHVVAAAAVDAVGNAVRASRTITVTDVLAPTISVLSPGASGGSTPWLSVRATDEGIGVDDGTWLVTVNGDPIAIDVENGRASGSIGELAPGDHGIAIAVADRLGNVARIVRTYHVDGAVGPQVPEIGGQTGVFLVSAPTAPVTWGTRASFTVFVARSGRPVRGQQVDAVLGGAAAGSAATNEDGLAVVTFLARAPGSYELRAAGSSMVPPAAALQVAPRLRIATSTSAPRVGQRVRVTGRVLPVLAGRRVALEARVGGSWYPLRRWATTDADGRFSTTVVGTTPGVIAVRARLSAAGGWSISRSAARVLHVR